MMKKIIDGLKNEVVVKRVLIGTGAFAGAVLMAIVAKADEPNVIVQQDYEVPVDAEPHLDIDG